MGPIANVPAASTPENIRFSRVVISPSSLPNCSCRNDALAVDGTQGSLRANPHRFPPVHLARRRVLRIAGYNQRDMPALQRVILQRTSCSVTASRYNCRGGIIAIFRTSLRMRALAAGSSQIRARSRRESDRHEQNSREGPRGMIAPVKVDWGRSSSSARPRWKPGGFIRPGGCANRVPPPLPERAHLRTGGRVDLGAGSASAIIVGA